MTAQGMEVLIYKGEKYDMASLPLTSYPKEKNIKWEPRGFFSACWRGYIGTWSIEDNKLYLLHIKSWGLPEEVINHIFNGQEKVFAQWYTGTLCIPLGKMLHYVHLGFLSVYEKDLFLEIENGILVSQYERKNK